MARKSLETFKEISFKTDCIFGLTYFLLKSWFIILCALILLESSIFTRPKKGAIFGAIKKLDVPYKVRSKNILLSLYFRPFI